MSQPLHEELRTLFGADAVLTAPSDTESFEIDFRRLYRGRALAVLLPKNVEQVAAAVRWCNQQRIGVVPQGGNTGYCGGATPDEVRAAAGAVAASAESHSRHRRGEFLDDGRSRLRPGGGAAGGRRRRALLSAQSGFGRQLPDRRQPVDQRRRPERRALRHDARAGAGNRGRAARRHAVRRSEIAAQGQYRLRPEVAADWLGRHARRDHRSDAEAVATDAQQRHGALGDSPTPADALAAAGHVAQRGRRAPEFLRTDAARRDRTDDALHRRRPRSAADALSLVHPVRADLERGQGRCRSCCSRP